MQNGCLCCTLQSDLVTQIVQLAQKGAFTYMIIEASGVSEPSQIAPLFELIQCDDDHDHEHEHGGPQLGEVARLDTCVTVVDAAQFRSNFESVKRSTAMDAYAAGTIAELLFEQIEYSNLVLLNKDDLVTQEQLCDIREMITLINPTTKLLACRHSKVAVAEIVDTHLFNADDMQNDIMIEATKVEPTSVIPLKTCCQKSVAEGGAKCCASDAMNGKAIDSGLSQLLLGPVASMTRHEARFGITSFVYRARRPFHPERLNDEFLEPFFLLDTNCAEEDVEQQQREADRKQRLRSSVLGDLLRSKGFIWIATAHNIMGSYSHAGNVAKLAAEGPWMCLVPQLWRDTPQEAFVMQDMIQSPGETLPDGTRPPSEAWPYGDRRQELVFIGTKLKYERLQCILDICLLQDDEMTLGPEGWEATLSADDPIQLQFTVEDDEEEEQAPPVIRFIDSPCFRYAG